MRPITVLVPLPPSYRGGTEEYAYRLVDLTSREFPLRVLTTRVRWGESAESLSVGRATLEVLPGTELWERPVVLSPAARAEIRSAVRDSSIVHLHMPFPGVERWVARWSRDAGVPLLLTYHMDASLPGRGLGALATRAYRALSARPALAAASAVVSNSVGYARTSPVLSAYLAKVRVVPKGVDADRLGIDAATTLPHPGLDLPEGTTSDRERRVLFVGRLVAYKGVPVLLDAYARVRAGGANAALYIAGRGPEEPSLREWVSAHDLGRFVRFLGFVPDERLGALYRWADVVVCPSISRMESTPTSLEEALSVGTPTLGSDLPGASETLPNDGVRGLLVPPGDAGALARGLERLLRSGHWNPERVRTWADVGQDYLALYRSLLPPPDRRSEAGTTPVPAAPAVSPTKV